MALKATIFKANLQIADMDRQYYADHALTLARHPSETDERMMVRLLAFARHAHARLVFGKGISDNDEPDIWQKDLTGSIERWIDVGLPQEKRILKASGRAKQVAVYSYGGHAAKLWWEGIKPKLQRLENLAVIELPLPVSQSLAKFAQRTMNLTCTIQDHAIWFSSEEQSVQVDYEVLHRSSV